MPVFTNTEFHSKNIKVQNPDGSKSVFMYFDPSSDSLSISHVNPDVNAVPTFENFNFDLSNKSEFYAAESMTSIYIYFDSNIGSSTTISSQNGTISGISPFGSNYFYFNFFCGSITDNLTITSYNSNNTKYKTVVIPITLKTTQAVPLGFTNAPTTQNYTYNNVVVNFNKSVKSIASITSLNQPSQTITYTTNNTSSVTLTNYKTPSNISDTLTFNGVVDTANITNISSVSKTIDNLKVGPSFVSVSSTNTISQNWTYTDIEAVFTKNIIQNPNTPISISASSGNQPTNIRIVDGKIKFDWTTSNVSSSTLSFNNLYASDFTFDDGTVENTTFTLSSQPITPQWYANQPVSKNTSYTGVEVNFNKRITAVDIVSDGTISNKTINARGNVQFDILTGSTNSTYTFNNIVAEDKGRNTGLILTTGPTITSYANSTGTSNDNKVLIQTTNQTFSFTFNKSISNNPTITLNSGTGVYVSKVNNTLTYNLSNITVGSNLITFGTVLASDASSSSGLTVPLVPVPALTFDLISDVSQPLINKNAFDVGTEYDLYAKFNNPPDLNSNFSGVGVACPNATVGAITSVDGNNKYKFKLTPTTASTNQLTVTNAKDVNNFVYSLFTSGNLTFTFTIPFPTTNLLSWYDVNDSSTITMSNTFIQRLNDKYGSFNMTDNSPSSNIVTESGKSFYRNTETASGLTTSNSLVSTHTTSYTSATYFVAMRFPNSMSGGRIPIGFMDNAGTNNFRWYPISGTTIYADMQHATSVSAWTIEINKWYVFEFEYTNDKSNIRARIFNNTDTSYHSGPGQPAYPPNKLAFGSYVDIGEVLYYNNVLTANDSNVVCNYLKNKWGMV